jgi:hypothetical protein
MLKSFSWPKKSTEWIDQRTLFVSIPFTWLLPDLYSVFQTRSFLYDKIIIGGPGIELIPNFFNDLTHVEVRHSMPGVLQKINLFATRTTIGCPRKCKFCGIGKGLIEAEYKELKEWPDLPVLMDNNLLASSEKHFDKVMERLKKHSWCDFNQGIDVRLLNPYHAKRLAELHNPVIRLALDSMKQSKKWERAFELLRKAGIAKSKISSYCLIGFNDKPDEAWKRCDFVESFKIKAYPMWYHALDQLRLNIVTEKQKKLGWSEEKRKQIMGYYYKHRGQHLLNGSRKKQGGKDTSGQMSFEDFE